MWVARLMTLDLTTATVGRTHLDADRFDTLDALESEAIHIFREEPTPQA